MKKLTYEESRNLLKTLDVELDLRAVNDNTFRHKTRALQESLQDEIKRNQELCSHMQGCNILSEEQGNRTSIWWHILGDGRKIGICPNCQRLFVPEDTDYNKWVSKKSGNRRSSSANQNWGYSFSCTREEYLEGIKDQFCPLDNDTIYSYEVPDIDTDKLSTKQIKDILNLTAHKESKW